MINIDELDNVKVKYSKDDAIFYYSNKKLKYSESP